MRSCTRRIVVHTTTTRTRVVLRSRESLRPLSTKGSTDSSRSSSRAVDESRSRAVDESRSRVAGESSSSRVAAADEGGPSFLEDRALRRNVFTLVGSQIMLNIGVSQVVPVLPVLASEMDLGAAGMGSLMAASSAARLALNLPLGRLCDTHGRKPLMRWGTLVTAVGSIGTGAFMHNGLLAVLSCRLLVGAGTASSMTGSQAMMADFTDAAPQHRAQIMALQSFVLSSIWVVGPMAGGLLAEAWGVQNSFYVAGAGVGLCSIGYAFLPETLRQRASSASAAAKPPSAAAAEPAAVRELRGAAHPTGSDETITYGTLLRAPNVQALSALAMSTSFSQGCFMAVLTLHARALFDASAADIGLMFSLVGISYVAGGPIGGWLAGRVGRKALIVPGLALSNAAFGALVLAGGRESFLALLLLSNFSSACVSPAQSAFTAEVLPPEARGQAMSISRMSGDVASLAAPLSLGMLADVTSTSTAILATAALCGGCTSVFALRALEDQNRWRDKAS